MTRARNIAGFSTITTTPSPIHVGPIGVLTATRIDGEFNVVDIATRDLTAQGIGVTNLQVSGITTGLNVSGIITAQNGINFNGTSTGLNVSGVTTVADLTATTISVGGTLTYEDVTSVDSVGVVTARGLSIFGNTTGLQVASGISTFQAVTGTTGTFSGDVSIADKIVHTGDTDTAIRFPGDDVLTVELSGTEHLRVDTTATRITDKLAHTGDPDTMIRFPAANTFTVETAGQERIRVDASGRLGINDTSPDSILAIKSTDNTTYDASQASHQRDAGVTLRIQNLSTTTDSFAQILLRNQGSQVGGCRIVSINKGNDASDLAITTGDTSEALRIDANGRVLIGHQTSDGQLSIVAANSSLPRVVISNPDNDENLNLSTYHDSNGIYAVLGANHKLDANGNFAVDTTSHKASGIFFDARNNGTLEFYTGDAGGVPGQRVFINKVGQVGVNTTVSNVVTGNNYATVHIGGSQDGGGNDGGGNVFIGNIFGGGAKNPKNAQLTLGGRHNSTGYNDDGQIKLYITGSNNDGTVTHYPLYMEDENGNVQVVARQKDNDFGFGVGTASPDTAIHVKGNQTAVIRLENDTAMGQDYLVGAVEFEKQDASGAGAGICGGMRCRSDDSYGARTYLAFSTRGNSTGQAATDGERLRIMAQGGITFNGDTSYDNALDDYEQGTFTPTISQGYSSISYHHQNGYYTKIGNFVHYSIYIYVYQATGANAAVKITLPFTSSSDTRRESGGYATYDNATFSSSWNEKSGCAFLIGTNASVLRPIKRTNGAEIYGNDTELGTGGNNRYFHISGQFYTG